MGYLFALVYTSLDDILPRVHELWTVGQKDDTKEGRQAAKERLAQIIQVIVNNNHSMSLSGTCSTRHLDLKPCGQCPPWQTLVAVVCTFIGEFKLNKLQRTTVVICCLVDTGT